MKTGIFGFLVSKSKTTIAKRKFDQGDITISILKVLYFSRSVCTTGLIGSVIGILYSEKLEFWSFDQWLLEQ